MEYHLTNHFCPSEEEEESSKTSTQHFFQQQKKLVWMAAARIARKILAWMAGECIYWEKARAGWLGRVFSEKEARLEGLAILGIQKVSPEFSFMV